MVPKIGNYFLRSLVWLLFNSLPARVHPLDFPVPDGLERLRRDRRGSAVAFHAGTIHPQNPPGNGRPSGQRAFVSWGSVASVSEWFALVSEVFCE
jgi:hypothetical protein